MPVTLRRATPDDSAVMAEIYRYYVLNTAITFEYTAPDAESFGKRIAEKSQMYPFLAAEKDGEVIGYAYGSRFREREAYGWAAELSVYLRQDARGGGVGRLLYSALMDLLREQNITSVYGCVTCPNDASFRLHEALGFTAAGRFTAVGNKLGRWHDVVWFEKRLCTGEAKKVIPFHSLDSKKVNDILSAYSR